MMWEEYSVQDTPEDREQQLYKLFEELPPNKVEEDVDKRVYTFNGVEYG